MPVWHRTTKEWVSEGRLVLLGVTQEQHDPRCRLFAQWQEFNWPILHDPINVLEPQAVPIVVAIDEHGIVRAVDPKPQRLEEEFLNKVFADDAPRRPAGRTVTEPPDLDSLRNRVEKTPTAAHWRELGDALVLWGEGLNSTSAIDAYRRALLVDSRDGNSWFRLGVCHRMRYDLGRREAGDFQKAVDYWSLALEIDPNQYIWRRRIQQYGPRLDKPYPFYDWVDTALAEITARGEEPVELDVHPSGAEIAKPNRRFESAAGGEQSPDAAGRIHRDKDNLIVAEVTVVPGQLTPGGSARVHVIMRPSSEITPRQAIRTTHWNNENSPLTLWVDAPEGWELGRQLVKAKAAAAAESSETRHLEFEVKAPANADGKTTLKAYALYYVCAIEDGKCLFLRQDLEIPLTVSR